MPDKEFRVKVVLSGIEELASKLAGQIGSALKGVKVPAIQNILQPFGRLAEGLTGGLVSAEKFSKGLGGGEGGLLQKLTGGLLRMRPGGGRDLLAGATGGLVEPGSKAAGAAGTAAGASIAGPVAGAMAGMKIFEKMADALEGLAPIQALLKVITTIFQLAMLPLAMVLMAILMPFLMPLLQILGKLPWAAIFAATQAISNAIGKFLALIWQGIVAIAPYVAKAIGVLSAVIQAVSTFFGTLISMYIAMFKDVMGGIAVVVKDIWAGIMALANLQVEIDKDVVGAVEAVASVFETIGGDIYTGIQVVMSVIGQVWAWLSGIFATMITDVHNWIQDVDNVLKAIWNWFTSIMQPIFSAIKTVMTDIEGVINALNPANAGSNLVAGIEAALGLASGGAVVQKGIAYIHAGETVLPKGTVGVAGQITTAAPVVGHSESNSYTVNVTGNSINSNVDVQQMADTIAKAIGNKRRRLSVW